MSDTPRTDAFCTTPTEYYVGQESRLIPGWIDFARQLERELAEARAECERLAASEARIDALRHKAEIRCELLLEELKNIAKANPMGWDPEVRDQFQAWAQNRARYAIDAARKAPK